MSYWYVRGTARENAAKGEHDFACIMSGMKCETLRYTRPNTQYTSQVVYDDCDIRITTPTTTPGPPEAKTSLTYPVAAGVKVLPVLRSNGFQTGRTVVIDPGSSKEEAHTIAGFGSIILKTPLQYHHPADTIVMMPKSSGLPPQAGAVSLAEESS
jgi:hypothetical protein